MDDRQKLLLIAQVLRKGKALAPDRFPQPNQETVAAWSDALNRLMGQFPSEEIWLEAISVWSTELAGDRMITPRELKDAVYVVRDRWEHDPIKRELLKANRLRAQQVRDRQIDDGTFGEVRGYRKPKHQALPNPDRDVAGIIDRIFRKEPS